MKRLSIWCVIFASLAGAGCQATYTSIRQVDPTRYHVTRTKQGFFKTYGTVFDCVAQGDTMTCMEISDL